MIYVLIENDSAKVITSEEAKARKWVGVQCRTDWNSMQDAEEIALLLNLFTDIEYIATDAGECVSPRYDVIEAPQVGDPVSYSFNGDTTPCGTIASISKSLKLITTTDGKKFYRRKNSGSWVMNGTWSLVHGHITERNPHF